MTRSKKTSKNILRSDLESNNETGTREITCKYCEQIFVTIFDFGSHASSCGRKPLLFFICDLCSKRYSSKRSIIQHMQQMHLPKKIMCKYCGIILRRSDYKIHESSKICRRRYRCAIEFCHKSFKTKRLALRHSTLHGSKKKFKCSKCNKKFITQGEVWNHKWVHKKREEKQNPFTQVWTIKSVPYKIFK